MRRTLTIVAVIALAGAAGVAAKPKAAKVAPPASAPAPPLPTSVDRLDITQFEAVIKGIGWQKSFGRVDGAVPYMGIISPLGMPYQLSGVQCPDETGRNCEAIRLRYMNAIQLGSAAAVAREINTKQSFLRTRFQPDTQGGQPYLFPERTIILKGGVTPAQIAANLNEYDRWVIDLLPTVGYVLPHSYTGPRTAPVVRVAPAEPAGSGLMPGRYRTTITNSVGTFSEDICMTASDMRQSIPDIAADLTNGGSGCSTSGGGSGFVTMRGTGRIVEGNIPASGMTTSLRWTGNALIDTDSMGGRDRIQFSGSASRIGDC